MGIVEEAGMAHLWSQFVNEAEDGSTFPVDPVLLFLGGVDKEIVDEALPHLEDYSVPRVYQDIMLEKVRKEGLVLRTVDFKTSHSVFITKQEEMVQLVVEAAEDERNPV
ncbi:hypothetical protein EYZ11_009513 [Aspergillus tanneri]|uniref:Uncharacterized protein n=1 Tax=Aspergillus tanneri TaxID=1220188 RepID=A0A4S3JD40_9EURO|nr:hypothetical protein EYZ11_009513 [Aspergillus tanneri]